MANPTRRGKAARSNAGSPGAMHASSQFCTFLIRLAASVGGWVPLARRLDRPVQTLVAIANGKRVRAATGRDWHAVVRAVGFDGPTGFEVAEVIPLRPLRALPSPSPSSPPPPDHAA